LTYVFLKIVFDYSSKMGRNFSIKFGIPHIMLHWTVQCFVSTPSHGRLYGRQFLQVKRPNQQYQSTEGNATQDKSNNKNNKIHICTDNNPHKKRIYTK